MNVNYNIMENKDKNICPHCGSRLLKWLPPAESSWGNTIQYVCFDDECPYYQRGWDHMMSKYQVKASYRFRRDAETGETGPLPVWSDGAVRNRIVQEGEEES
jgi:hypothetical protein